MFLLFHCRQNEFIYIYILTERRRQRKERRVELKKAALRAAAARAEVSPW